MCGIVGAVAERNVVPVLMEGLKRLEYRGYDSAGIAVAVDDGITRIRRLGKVRELQSALDETPIRGVCGISHTRWATHGMPSERNAHPHMSNSDVAIVHNGIIENYEELRDDLKKSGYEFSSETDTEIVSHRIHTQGMCEETSARASRSCILGSGTLACAATREKLVHRNMSAAIAPQRARCSTRIRLAMAVGAVHRRGEEHSWHHLV